MTGKYTLVFDANFFLHKTFFIAQKIKKGKPLNFIDDYEGDKNILLWKLCIDFASEVRRFDTITNRIVYCIDTKSWRKDYAKKDYKANRVKGNDIDWSAIYKVHDEFANALETLGVITSRINGAEADDLIFAWSSYLNQQDQNALIISGDNDLLQLVNIDKSSNANTLYYNKFTKNINCFPKFDEWVSVKDPEIDDIFNLPLDILSNTKKALSDIILYNKMKTSVINTEDFIFKKILIGDAGDNVSSLYVREKETKGGIRRYRVTDRHATLILDKFKENRIHVNQTHFFNEDMITQICEFAKDVVKIPLPLEDIIDKWKVNRDLMYLHKTCIPDKVNDAMFSSIESSLSTDTYPLPIQKITNKDILLEGTSYSKKTKNEVGQGSIFNKLDEYNQTITKKVDEKTQKGFNSNLWDDLLS